jgi:hypothetical protein
MNSTSIWEHPAPGVAKSTVLVKSEYGLNVVVAYQDAPAQSWAAEVWGQVMQLTGKDNINVTSWRISDLAWSRGLADAVRSATKADVIVVSVIASEELPLDFYVWIDAWLPRRVHGTGALVALISLPQKPHHRAFNTRNYLQAVAHRGGLDFLPRERVLPVAATDISGMETVKNRVDSLTLALAGMVGGVMTSAGVGK